MINKTLNESFCYFFEDDKDIVMVKTFFDCGLVPYRIYTNKDNGKIVYIFKNDHIFRTLVEEYRTGKIKPRFKH